MLENKGTVNSLMTFKGGPIKVLFKVAVPDEEGDTTNVQIEAKITYQPGRVVKEEAVTTPAGTFNCSKWEYSYELITKTFLNGRLQDQSNELRFINEWTAPGVGIVKLVESDMQGTPTSETELKRVD